ncbi:MAG: response regulator transcription factor [bacterium]|nr:response regulator transcription factor [bacterium]
MSRQRIVVVEDEPDILEILRYNLEREGYAVDAFSRGDEALEGIRKNPPDLLLLDLMLPGMDGLEITRLLKRSRETAEIPLIMLTAKDQEVDRIVGLELGADDYLAKPFSPREVVLRVKAVLRRSNGSPSGAETSRVGGLELDIPAHRLLVNGIEVEVTATEFRLIRVLMERAGRVQTRTQLLADVWRYSEDVDSRTVDTHVRRLRKKLGREATRIETVIGVGYRLKA